jgi:hypothetical protein
MSPRDIEEFVILLEQLADPVSLHDYPATGTCRDPKDEPYLQTAMAGRADFIVSGDNDLLALKSINNIRIITPSEFERVMKNRRKADLPPASLEVKNSSLIHGIWARKNCGVSVVPIGIIISPEKDLIKRNVVHSIKFVDTSTITSIP